MGLSTFSENNLLKVFKNEAPTKAEHVFVKLHTGAAGLAGTSNAAGETTRKEATLGAITSGVVKNSAALEWTAVSTAETYTNVSLWDASSAGNCLGEGALEASQTVSVGSTFKIAIEALSITLS